MSDQLVNRQQLVALVSSGAVRKCVVLSAGDVWLIQIKTPAKDYLVAKHRQARQPAEPRPFKSLDTACQFIHDIGIGSFTVDAGAWRPRQGQLAARTPTTPSSAGQ